MIAALFQLLAVVLQAGRGNRVRGRRVEPPDPAPKPVQGDGGPSDDGGKSNSLKTVVSRRESPCHYPNKEQGRADAHEDLRTGAGTQRLRSPVHNLFQVYLK